MFSVLPLDMELAARLASIFMDSLVVAPLYFLGRTFLSRAGAAAAAVLWAFFSFALYFSVSPLSQSTCLFFLILAVLVFVKATEQSASASLFFISGIIFALSYLARPEGVVSFAAAGGSLILLSAWPGQRLRFVRGAILLLCGFLLAAGPYLIFLRSSLGYWAVSGKVDVALKTIDGALTLDRAGKLTTLPKGFRAWQEHYGSIAGFQAAVRSNVTQFAEVVYRTFPWWFLVAAAAGLVLLAFRRKWRTIAFLCLIPAATLPNYIVNIPKTHSYLYALFPFLFLLFAVPFDAVLRGKSTEVLPRYRMKETALTALILLPSLWLGYAGFRTAVESFHDPGIAEQAILTEKIYKESGIFLRGISSPGDMIVTRWGLIGYYADRHVIDLPKGGPREVIDYGRRNGGRFLIIDTPAVFSRREELMELLAPLDGRGVNPDYRLQVVQTALHPDIGGYVIYRYLE
jgi:4-amino-4-deoxy-L-arabinose transferase-like glycosyltransferase